MRDEAFSECVPLPHVRIIAKRSLVTPRQSLFLFVAIKKRFTLWLDVIIKIN